VSAVLTAFQQHSAAIAALGSGVSTFGACKEVLFAFRIRFLLNS
jgi:hypothetical protein